MNKKELKLGLMIVMILFVTMLVVSSGTFAYFQWQSSTEQITALNVSVADDINMRIDPASVTKTGMRPTNNCDGDACMTGTSTVTIDNQTGVLARPRFKLKLKVEDSEGNNITNEPSPMGNPYRYYIKYKVVRRYSSAETLISGRFDLDTETSVGSGWYDSPDLTLNDENGFPQLSSGIDSGVSFNALPNSVTDYTYAVHVWIDSEYTTVNTGDVITVDKLQNATITVSWSENSTVEQVYEGVIRPEGVAYAVYSANDTSLRFYRSTTPIEVGSTYNDKPVTAVYTGFENKNYNYDPDTETINTPWYSYRNDITKVIVEDEIVPISTVFWFYDLVNCSSIDVTKLNTSYTTDFTGMFYSTGYNATTFNITGMNDWNTSNVKSMRNVFSLAGRNATTWSIGDLSDWDTSNVTNMYALFNQAGRGATEWSIGDLSDWDTSKVTDMKGMFNAAGYSATTFNIGNLSDWDTSNVTTMYAMFQTSGYSATTWSIGDLSDWDVSKVTDMSWLFCQAGRSTTSWSIGDLSGWDTSSVTTMRTMFGDVGKSTTAFNIGNLDNWNVSNVTTMYQMFAGAGEYSTTWNIGDLTNWDVSNVITMYAMFSDAGYSATTFDIGNLGNWDVSKVTNMIMTFNHAGWSATTWNIGDLSSWDVSNVTSMEYMFNQAGRSATKWSVGDISGWDTSNVTDMGSMFSAAGLDATYTLDLSSWNVCNVIDHEQFNGDVDTKITPPNWDMECPA